MRLLRPTRRAIERPTHLSPWPSGMKPIAPGRAGAVAASRQCHHAPLRTNVATRHGPARPPDEMLIAHK